MSRREIECSDRATTVGSTIAVDYSMRATIGAMGSNRRRSGQPRPRRRRWRAARRRSTLAAVPRPDLARRPPAGSTTWGSTIRRSRPRSRPRPAPATVARRRGSSWGAPVSSDIRQAADARELDEARADLRAVDRAGARSARADRAAGRAGRAAVSRGSLRRRPPSCWTRWWRPRRRSAPDAHERALDWWATALDRQAQTLPACGSRGRLSRASSSGWKQELRRDPASAPATYWLAAVGPRRRRSRSRVGGGRRRAGCAPRSRRDRGVALRADLDKLVTQAIIPDRAATRRSPRRDRAGQAMADLDSHAASGRTSRSDAGRAIASSSGQPAQLFASFQFSPIPTSTVTGTLSVDRRLHQLAHRRGGFVGRVLRRLEEQLVVDGQDHPRAAAGDATAAPRARRSSPSSGCRPPCPGSAC